MCTILYSTRVTTELCYPYTGSSYGRCEIPRDLSLGRCTSGIQYRIENVYHATPPYRIAPDVGRDFVITVKCYNHLSLDIIEKYIRIMGQPSTYMYY